MSELLRRIILFIYRLPLRDLIQCAVYAALIYVTLLRKYEPRPWLRPCMGLLLALWAAVALWTTVLDRDATGGYGAHWLPLHSYRALLSGGNPEMLRSSLMNALLFFPAGLLSAGLVPRGRSFQSGMLRILLGFALFSMAIELTQYHFQLGVCEMDDVLHNALGAAAGYAAFHLETSEPPTER